jgi:6-phosphogluconolactonase
MSAHWKAYPDAEAAAAACAEHVLSVLESAVAGNNEARIAFSGGSTPKLMFAQLAASGFDWSRVRVFWVDERAVPPDHADSNYRMTCEHLIKPARIPQRNVYRVHAELSPQQAAKRYEEDIRESFGIETGELPHFDLLHLGVGSDSHTASLFPGEPLIDDREHLTAAVYVEKLSQWRITLLPGVLLSARHAAILACGEDKAVALKHVLLEPYSPQTYPAQIIAHHSRRATWFLDAPAAALLD